MNKTVVIGVAFVIAVVAYLAYSSMHIAKYRVEVCIEFHGANQCRTASAERRIMRCGVRNRMRVRS